ncbi:AraC family transcriptional regulator [Paenibacillus sp. GYB003]|uniref:AraC family transcriptional regulator n=1 Tax=Paenibacillus sp. GYB003 TaxID=2994392 RepID=UPI002F9691E5
MDYEFLSGFHPKIINVLVRDPAFWEAERYVRKNDVTQLHVLAYVYGGEGTLELDDFSGALHAGCIFQIYPGRRMCITSSRERPLSFYSIHFQYGIVRWDGMEGSFRSSAAGPLPFPDLLRAEDGFDLQDAFARVFRTWNEMKVGYEWYAKTALMTVLAKLSSALSSPDGAEDDSKRQIAASIAYIRDHYKEPLQRGDLAAVAALSPGYFNVMFKRHTGYTPVEYITKVRIDKAKQMLHGSRMPVQKIAQEVGYADSYYFSRVFKQEVGLTPREYRKA